MKFFFYSLLLSLLLYTHTARAQQSCNLHIVTIPGNTMGFPFHFTINGEAYKLKGGQCLRLTLSADSVQVLLEDRRWVKNKIEDLHVKAEPELYISIYWGFKEGEKKKLRLIAQVICKSCFEEMSKNCKKLLEG